MASEEPVMFAKLTGRNRDLQWQKMNTWKQKTVNSKIRICVECGNTDVFQNQQSIMCEDCGNVGYFSD